MTRRLLVFLFICISLHANAGNKIRYYFNHPVDNSVSTGVNATYVHNSMGDTIISYINHAKYTLDIAVYNFTSTATNIATAINNAYARGVAVRYIYDAGQSNTALPYLNSAINTLGSPQTSNYTIMHSKFMVIDANSPDPTDAYVWTGSSNWNSQQFNYDYNNCILLQDAPLAKAYVDEFNMMWGGSGIAPDPSASKFGQYKTDLGNHDFTIDGIHVELYFSPSDHTNNHILSTIASADKDLYFGMYTFTYATDATNIVTKFNSGVYAAGIDDYSSHSSSPYSTLMSGLGSSNFKEYNGPGNDIYHNKYLIVDPSDPCSDPVVLTGSHNWSFNADTKNDENTLIIHDATAANIYYQSFKADFAAMGGSLTPVAGCTTYVPNISAGHSVTIFPNPAKNRFTINFQLTQSQIVDAEIYNVVGQKVATVVNNSITDAGMHSFDVNIDEPGIYFLKVIIGNELTTHKVLISK